MSESAKRRCENPEWIASQIARGTQLDEAAVRQMYENGMTQAEIANNLHVSQKVVWRFMNRHGIKARKAAKRKQQVKTYNFTEEQLGLSVPRVLGREYLWFSGDGIRNYFRCEYDGERVTV